MFNTYLNSFAGLNLNLEASKESKLRKTQKEYLGDAKSTREWGVIVSLVRENIEIRYLYVVACDFLQVSKLHMVIYNFTFNHFDANVFYFELTFLNVLIKRDLTKARSKT